jgi:hypothetical protein
MIYAVFIGTMNLFIYLSHCGVRNLQLSKQFLKYNNRSFVNIITGDETCVHFYEPNKIYKKIWSAKGSQIPCMAKRTMNAKMVLFAYINQGPAIQIAVRKGKSVNAYFYKGNIHHKLRKYFKTVDQQLVSVVSGCCMAMLRHTKRQLYENI